VYWSKNFKVGLPFSNGLITTAQRPTVCWRPQTLAQLPLLHKGRENGSDAAPEWAWRTWFTRLGLGAPVPRGLRFDDIGPAISGALDGTGVVLGRSLLCADALAEAQLARVLPPDWDVLCDKVCVATWPAVGIGDSRIRDFVRWIDQTAKGSVGPVVAVNCVDGPFRANACTAPSCS